MGVWLAVRADPNKMPSNQRKSPEEVEGIFADLRVTTAKLEALRAGERIFATNQGHRYIATFRAVRPPDRPYSL